MFNLSYHLSQKYVYELNAPHKPCGALGVKVDLVLRKRRLGSVTPLGKPACHNLGLGRRTYASGNSEEMEIQNMETRESI